MYAFFNNKIMTHILKEIIIINYIIMTDKLEDYRVLINDIDSKILKLLDDRMVISKHVGIYKKENNIKILNSNRETEVIDALYEKINMQIRLGQYSDITKDMISDIWTSIFKYSRKVQK